MLILSNPLLHCLITLTQVFKFGAETVNFENDWLPNLSIKKPQAPCSSDGLSTGVLGPRVISFFFETRTPPVLYHYRWLPGNTRVFVEYINPTSPVFLFTGCSLSSPLDTTFFRST